MKKLFLLMVLISSVQGADYLSWDEIGAGLKFDAVAIVEPQLAKYLCLPEETDYIEENAEHVYYAKPLNGEVELYFANNADEAALLAYCEHFNLGEQLPKAFEVKGPVQRRAK